MNTHVDAAMVYAATIVLPKMKFDKYRFNISN